MAKRLQRLCRTPPKRLAAMRAFAWRYEENVRFQRRVAGKVLRSSRPPQNRTCEFPPHTAQASASMSSVARTINEFCNKIGTKQTHEIPAVFVRFSRHSRQF